MKPTLFLLLMALFLPACSSSQLGVPRAYALTNKPEVERAVTQMYAAGRGGREAVTLSDIELFRVGGRYTLYAAVAGWKDSAGTPRSEVVVFTYDDDRIQWVASPDEPMVERRVLSLRPTTLPGFDGPVIEVFAIDLPGQPGVGHYYLYHLNEPGKTLELKLKTLAVDQDPSDGVRINGQRLGSVYYAPTRFRKAGAIALAGIVEEYAPDAAADAQPIKRYRASKFFYWNNIKKRYEPNREQWHGFQMYPEE